MTASRARRARIWLPCVLAASMLLLSGCVYLRLLALKRQLAEFDRHFALQTDVGVKIIAQDPVLRADDVRWLGLRPESIRKLGQAELWHVRWVKQLPPGVAEKASYHIALDLTFANRKLTGISIPESYFALLPKDFLIGVLRSLGGAAVDKSEREVEAAVAAQEVRLARPNLPTVDRILGVPTEERADGEHTIQRYRYLPASSEPGARVFEMVLRYHTASGELLHWRGRTPMGNIAFDFAPKPAAHP